jgi:hypothetical protein
MNNGVLNAADIGAHCAQHTRGCDVREVGACALCLIELFAASLRMPSLQRAASLLTRLVMHLAVAIGIENW